MKISRWQIFLGAALFLASTLLYFVHYLLFRDIHHIFIYLLGDIAFIPIEVFIVTVILHELLNSREKRGRMEKLNMVVGAFFSEIGVELLKVLAAADSAVASIYRELLVRGDWDNRKFLAAAQRIRRHPHHLDQQKLDLAGLNRLLRSRRDFFLRLLENPNLLEHGKFTDLLWSIFHLTEELNSRSDLTRLGRADAQHLVGDCQRVYQALLGNWLDYMKHLQKHYPYLFSLAVRKNPFDPEASVVLA